MYYLFIVVLEGCPYSNAALELLTDNKINFKSLKVISKKYLTYTDFINSNKINILTLISILSLFLLFLKLHSLKNINDQ